MVYGPLARETTAEVARGFDPREALLGQTRKSGREPLRSNFRTNDSAESSTIEGPRTLKITESPSLNCRSITDLKKGQSLGGPGRREKVILDKITSRAAAINF